MRSDIKKILDAIDPNDLIEYAQKRMLEKEKEDSPFTADVLFDDIVAWTQAICETDITLRLDKVPVLMSGGVMPYGGKLRFIADEYYIDMSETEASKIASNHFATELANINEGIKTLAKKYKAKQVDIAIAIEEAI